jgi:ribonuclease HI
MSKTTNIAVFIGLAGSTPEGFGKVYAASAFTAYEDGKPFPDPSTIEVSKPDTFSGRLNSIALTVTIETLQALKEVLEKTHDGRVMTTVYVNATYVRDGFYKWMPMWQKNGWRTKNGDVVKQKDQWLQLEKLLDGLNGMLFESAYGEPAETLALDKVVSVAKAQIKREPAPAIAAQKPTPATASAPKPEPKNYPRLEGQGLW